MAGQRGEFAQLAAFDFDEACGGDAGAVQEGGVLEGAALFDADVQAHVGVGDEDPGVFLRGLAQEVVHHAVGVDVVEFGEAAGVVEFIVGVLGVVFLLASAY